MTNPELHALKKRVEALEARIALLEGQQNPRPIPYQLPNTNPWPYYPTVICKEGA